MRLLQVTLHIVVIVLVMPNPTSVHTKWQTRLTWLRLQWLIYENVLLCRYDSFSGARSTQKSIAFEKGSILFNIGVLYAQKGARQVRQCSFSHVTLLYSQDAIYTLRNVCGQFCQETCE